MLAHFVKKAKTGGSNISIQAVMSMVSDVTHVEQRALFNAAEDAHIGKVFMMEEGLAAAFGAGVLPTDKRATAIVDIGAGTTNIAIVAKGSVVHSTSERYGSNAINESLATHFAATAACRSARKQPNSLKTTFASTFFPRIFQDHSRSAAATCRRAARRRSRSRRARFTRSSRASFAASRIACQGHSHRTSPRGRRRHLRSRRHHNGRRCAARGHRSVHACLHQSSRHRSPKSRVMRPSTAS